MNIDLSKCKPGDILVSKHGLKLEYVEPLPVNDYFDHKVKYPDGSFGTRINNGMTYKNFPLPEDHDIVKIIHK